MTLMNRASGQAKWGAVAVACAVALIAASCGSDSTVDTQSAVDVSETVAAEESAQAEPEVAAVEEPEPEPTAVPEPTATPEPTPEPTPVPTPTPEPLPVLEWAFDGLEPLGAASVYEGWAIIDDAPVSTGRFNLSDDNSIVALTEPEVPGLETASAIVLTIEPAEGDDPAPSDVHVLAGDLVDGAAELTISHPAAIGTDFATAGGVFILGTPTTAVTDDELSGVWFVNLGPTRAGLELPALGAGWTYEGWVVIDGIPVSTGRFSDPAMADDFNGLSGPDGTGPPFPGEDFIVNAPDGLSFPTDLRNSTVVISVEPVPDDSPAPFALKPLATIVPDGIGDHVVISSTQGPPPPSGLAVIG